MDLFPPIIVSFSLILRACGIPQPHMPCHVLRTAAGRWRSRQEEQGQAIRQIATSDQRKRRKKMMGVVDTMGFFRPLGMLMDKWYIYYGWGLFGAKHGKTMVDFGRGNWPVDLRGVGILMSSELNRIFRNGGEMRWGWRRWDRMGSRDFLMDMCFFFQGGTPVFAQPSFRDGSPDLFGICLAGNHIVPHGKNRGLLQVFNRQFFCEC